MTSTVHDEIEPDPTDFTSQPETKHQETMPENTLKQVHPSSALEGILLTMAGTQARHLQQDKIKDPGLEALQIKLRSFTPNVIKEAIDASTLDHLLQAQDNLLQKSKIGYYKEVKPPICGTQETWDKMELQLLSEIPSYKPDGINEAGVILESINELVEHKKSKKLLAKLILKKFASSGDSRRLWLQTRLRQPEHLIDMENVFATVSKWDNLINCQQYKSKLLTESRVWDGKSPLEDALLEVYHLATRSMEDDEPNQDIFRYLVIEGYLVRLPTSSRQLVRNQITGREKLLGRQMNPDEIYKFITSSLSNEIWLHTKAAGNKAATVHQLYSAQQPNYNTESVTLNDSQKENQEFGSHQQRKDLFNTLSAKISANITDKLSNTIHSQINEMKDDILNTSNLLNSQTQQIHQLTNIALQTKNNIPVQQQNSSFPKTNKNWNTKKQTDSKPAIPMNKQTSFDEAQCVVHPQFRHRNKDCFTQITKQFGDQNCVIHSGGNHSNSQCIQQNRKNPKDDTKCDLHPNSSHTNSQCRAKLSTTTHQQPFRIIKPQTPLFVNLTKPQQQAQPNKPKRGGPKPGSKEEQQYFNRCWRCGLPATMEAKQTMLADGWKFPDVNPHRAKDCPIYNTNDAIGFHVCSKCDCGFHTDCKNL